MSIEELYQKFVSSLKGVQEPFCKLFELVNIKSFSEAYCESVGSMMNRCVDNGRNLSAANFSRELIFAFNAPPLHILNLVFIPEVVRIIVDEKKIMFFRKLDNTADRHRLRFETVSASIGNYRIDAEKKSHLPINFFK